MSQELRSRKIARYEWPAAALRLVDKARKGESKTNAAALHRQLAEMTGYSDPACWRLLQRYGIERPGAGSRIFWSEEKADRAVEYAMDWGADEAAKKFGCSKKAITSLLWRKNRRAGHGHGMYSLHMLKEMLRVRHETLLGWIHSGILGAVETQYGSRKSYLVPAEALEKFCRKQAGKIAPRRFPAKRAEFVSRYMIEISPSELQIFKPREGLREDEAFARGEYLQKGRSERSG